MRDIVVLRMGHRPERDKRITTHVGLVARAFGASGMIITSRDTSVEQSINDATARWGGSFSVRSEAKWRNVIKDWKRDGGKICHMSMYGVNLPDVIEEIRGDGSKLMIVVGAEKVPSEIYDLADWNVAVGNQPHSEVGALAVFLDRLHGGAELEKKFNGQLEIIPQPHGKKVIEK